MKVIVVGRGLMGSAAARHLAKAGQEVVVIGPDEPAQKATHQGAFASHYDEGRITRKNALDPWWAEVSTLSIDRYREIEAESGVSFFTEAGAMMAGGPDWVARVEEGRRAGKVPCEVLDAAAMAERFPYFRFPADWAGHFEPDRAGHISPRRMVAAQTEAARQHGAQVVSAAVDAVGEGWVNADGQRFEADQVLVAAGAWTDVILGRPPKLTVYARTVALFEVDDSEVARLRSMPTLVYDTPEDPYLLPPIRYPDGRWYVKLGGDPEDVPLHGPDEIGAWFRSGGSAAVRDHLEMMVRKVMPDLAIERTIMDACVTSWTEDRLPEITRLSDRITICTGGNGAGAKCSDELGRRGAALAIETTGEFA